MGECLWKRKGPRTTWVGTLGNGLRAEFGKGNEQELAAFGRHVHWGYWDNPNAADGTVADLAAATERRLQRQMGDMATERVTNKT
ncbi:MAG: hypothetical protein EBE86_018160 [Hormoscilla sp. GUM202]|nr:hypothetical protein [Hormoscilla sp. GUM202]